MSVEGNLKTGGIHCSDQRIRSVICGTRQIEAHFGHIIWESQGRERQQTLWARGVRAKRRQNVFLDAKNSPHVREKNKQILSPFCEAVTQEVAFKAAYAC